MFGAVELNAAAWSGLLVWFVWLGENSVIQSTVVALPAQLHR